MSAHVEALLDIARTEADTYDNHVNASARGSVTDDPELRYPYVVIETPAVFSTWALTLARESLIIDDEFTVKYVAETVEQLRSLVSALRPQFDRARPMVEGFEVLVRFRRTSPVYPDYEVDLGSDSHPLVCVDVFHYSATPHPGAGTDDES